MIFSRRLSLTGVDLILRPRSRAARLSKAAAEAAVAGDSVAAEAGWRKALALREAAGAGGDDDQRADQCCLAGLLVRLGRPAEAAPFARAAIEGPQEDTLRARSCIASIVEMLCDTGRAEEAEPLARALLDVLASDPEARGTEEHARALSLLAAVLTAQERPEVAEAVIRQVIGVIVGCLGADHPVHAGLLMWIANIRQHRDDFAGAEALCHEALDIHMRSPDCDDGEVAGILTRLGLLLDRDGRSEEAVRILRRGLALLTGKVDALDPDRVALLGLLADKLSRLGRDAEAEPLCCERRAAIAATLGRSHPDYERACVALADVLVSLGRSDEAELLLRETLELAEGDGSPIEAAIPALTRLGWHLAHEGRFDEAEPCYREALSLAERAFGRDRPEFSEALDNLGWMIGTAGRYEEAEAIHRETLLLRAATPGCASEGYCNSFTNLAWVLWQMGRDREAERELDAGLAAMRAAGEPGDLMFLGALDKVASACRDEGNVEAAREHFRQLRTLVSNTFGPTDPRAEAAGAELVALAGDRPHDPSRLQ